MNSLRLVPGFVIVKDASGWYREVPFPERSVFEVLYKQEQVQRNWEMMKARNAGVTLDEIGRQHGVSRERVRQIEAKFLRKFRAQVLKTELSSTIGLP